MPANPPKLRQQTDSPVPLPYAPYFEAARTVVATAQERGATALRQWYEDSEGFVAACMKEAGFDYFPREYDLDQARQEAETAIPQGDMLDIPYLPSEPEEVERVGYGVITTNEYTGADQFAATPDQNSEYFAALSDAAQREYMLALYGYPEPRGEGSGPPLNPDNCADRAADRFPAPASEDISFLTTLDMMRGVMGGGQYTLDLETGQTTVDRAAEEWELWGSPDYQELSGEYTRCVESGDPSGAVVRWLGGEGATADPMAMLALAVATAPDGSVATPDGATGLDRPEEHSALVGSQAERDVALLDFKCRGETDYVARYAAAVAGVQARYIAEHQAEVDKLEAAMKDYLSAG
ncbi:MAG: hypothetical protein LBO20_00165 [Bifidobacteriaceae bacterium]|nr:hypothetical protein [Bifidobacteriaceae bacterium]